MSIPTSAIAATAAGLMLIGWLGTAGVDRDPIAGEVAEPSGRHL